MNSRGSFPASIPDLKNLLMQNYLSVIHISNSELITLILLGFVIQLLDLFPSWLVVLIAVELYAFRPLLANVIEMGKGYLEKGSNAIQLLLERIPRYQA